MHAWFDRDKALLYARATVASEPDRVLVLGTVAAAGTVRLHDGGFRAERAIILMVDTDSPVCCGPRASAAAAPIMRLLARRYNTGGHGS